MRLSEDNIRNKFCEYLQSQGLTEYAKEVVLGCNDSFCDLVYVDKKRKFVCVEFKLLNWKNVIEQALKLKKYTHLVNIAMPLPTTYKKRKMVEREVKSRGLGLFWLKNGKAWMRVFYPLGVDIDFKWFNDNLKESFYTNIHWTFLQKCIDGKFYD